MIVGYIHNENSNIEGISRIKKLTSPKNCRVNKILK